MEFLANTIISALIIGAVSELGKRSTFLSAILISIPITSVLSFSFLYLKTGDALKVASLSNEVFGLILPSLSMFILLPILLKSGIDFWISLALSSTALAVVYSGYSWALRRLGILS